MSTHFGLALLALLTQVGAHPAQPPQTSELVRQLGTFPASMDPRAQSNTGQRMPVEQQRESIHVRLRVLDAAAVPALRRGLSDPSVGIRRNVALYLEIEGGNYARHAPQPLDLKPFLSELVLALRDEDDRVEELTAQALGHLGPDGAVAVPDLLRLLQSPREGLRNSACVGLAGIGPAANDALPALRQALDDPSPDVRRFAQQAIDMITIK